MSFPKFSSGLVIGIIVGSVVATFAHNDLPILASVDNATSEAPIIRCAAQVPAVGWGTFRNNKLAFEIHYPSDYSLREETGGILLTSTGSEGFIRLEKIRGTMGQEILPEMRQAGWKVQDRQLYALSTPYFTDDNDLTLTETYLFVRDFPPKGDDSAHVMVRATIKIGRENADFQRARQAGVVDPESILTTPEQILSTFRFLQYDELPGRDTGAAKDL
jgi:hypothetical protein